LTHSEQVTRAETLLAQELK